MSHKETILKELQTLVKNGKIKSIRVNGELKDLRNINELSPQDYINVSNKYIKLLIDKGYSIKDLEFLMNNFSDINIIRKDNKLLSVNTSEHSNIQITKRLVYLCLSDIQLNENQDIINRVCSNNIDVFIDIILNKSWCDIKNNKEINDIIKIFLENSTVLTVDKMFKKRDLLSFNRRDNKHKGETVRYYSYPFLFIVEEGILKTVEFYTSNKDMRHHNKITSNNKKFIDWLKEIKSI